MKENYIVYMCDKSKINNYSGPVHISPRVTNMLGAQGKEAVVKNALMLNRSKSLTPEVKRG
jgi:kynureninase